MREPAREERERAGVRERAGESESVCALARVSLYCIQQSVVTKSVAYAPGTSGLGVVALNFLT